MTTEVPDYPFSVARALKVDPVYSRLRAGSSLTRIRLPYGTGVVWLASTYADVKAVLGDPRFSMAAATKPDTPRSTPWPMNSDGLMGKDGQEHARLRRLIGKAFTLRRVEALRPRIRGVVENCCDAMVVHGAPADLVNLLALPVPVTVICELLGVPVEDRSVFRAFAEAAVSSTKFSPEEVGKLHAESERYMAELVRRRRRAPAEDLLSALAQTEDNQDLLSEKELVEMGLGLLVAGHETTANQIGNFVYTLLSHPGLYQALCEDPSRIPQVVEELLRWVPLSASGGHVRVATEDVRLPGGLVRAGEAVFAQLASANRDESVFEEPSRIDFDRPRGQHVSFGHGPHACPGAHLARLELQVTLEVLVTRFPGLRIAVPENELDWRTGVLLRGLETFPVQW
ncbi:cytochrome P450 [Kutzneria viridogrisea]